MTVWEEREDRQNRGKDYKRGEQKERDINSKRGRKEGKETKPGSNSCCKKFLPDGWSLQIFRLNIRQWPVKSSIAGMMEGDEP